MVGHICVPEASTMLSAYGRDVAACASLQPRPYSTVWHVVKRSWQRITLRALREIHRPHVGLGPGNGCSAALCRGMSQLRRTEQRSTHLLPVVVQDGAATLAVIGTCP